MSKTMQSKWKVSAFSSQPVDIIIPFYGAYDKVSNLVSSLIYSTKVNPFRICLVDDCSPNNTFIHTTFEAFPNIKTIRNPKRMGFGASLYEGFLAMTQEKHVFPWVVFMHSDCEVKDCGWLLNLGETMLSLKSKGVKLVVPKTDNPISEYPLFKEDVFQKTKDVVLENIPAPLYCALCHKDLFRNIGGFIKPYPFMGYEGEELAWRMSKYGFKQAISGNSWIKHIGGVTKDYFSKKEFYNYELSKNNKQLFENDKNNFKKR